MDDTRIGNVKKDATKEELHTYLLNTISRKDNTGINNEYTINFEVTETNNTVNDFKEMLFEKFSDNKPEFNCTQRGNICEVKVIFK